MDKIEINRKSVNAFVTAILLLCFSFNSQSQNNSTPFRFVYDGMPNFDNIIAIEFINTKTKEIKGTFNMLEGNPFNNLNFPEVSKDRNNTFKHHKQYRVNNIKLKDFEIESVNLVKNKFVNDTVTLKNAMLYSYYSYNIFDSTLIIAFNLNLANESVLAAGNIFLVFNENGHLVNTIRSINHWCNEFTITADKKHFACSYGGYDNTPNGFFEKFGYMIYDLSKHVTLCSEKFDDKLISVGVRSYGNMIRIGLVEERNSEDLIYYNFDNGKKYRKNVPYDILFNIQNTNNDGFTYYKEGLLDTLYFEKDFQKEDFK